MKYSWSVVNYSRFRKIGKCVWKRLNSNSTNFAINCIQGSVFIWHHDTITLELWHYKGTVFYPICYLFNYADTNLGCVHCIAFPGSKVSQNDCRMRNMSYKHKNILHYDWSFYTRKRSGYTWGYLKIHPHIYINTVNLCYLQNLYMDESFFRQ
jgi:hypothetical protein